MRFQYRHTGVRDGKKMFPLLFAILLFSCQPAGSYLNSREKIFRNCMLGKNLTLDEEQNKKICNCLADKLTGAGFVSANPVPASDSVSKLFLDECRNQQ